MGVVVVVVRMGIGMMLMVRLMVGARMGLEVRMDVGEVLDDGERDRMNPFTSMSDDEFMDRFRLRKVSAVTLLEEVRNELPAAADLRGCSVPPHLQLLIAIRCMATGSHQVSQTTVGQCLKIVSRAIASRSRHYILPPAGTGA
ncbi:hypothetical protein Pcinc_007353 [Petrolisthes cinctipes]|uniref:Uncharacterized protein n=1 Tax=Petrolisthes cinctipes TaxID=88211 RepID=A0AAE1G8Q2_PETCI|nr:hypothetical protein Pcinc_007353 [Petrolisthes cinctipes]